MKPIQTFLRGNAIRLLVSAEEAIVNLSNGGIIPSKNFASQLDLPEIKSDVRVVSKNQSEVYITKDTPGDFVIMATTDFHFEDDMVLRAKTMNTFIRNIEAVKPDLIVLTGDIIESDHQQIDCVRFARMMEKIGVYWCFVFGNHEARAEKEYHKWFMLHNKTLYPHCLAIQGPEDLFGYGNYFINIMDNGKIRQSLVCLDSGRDINDDYRFSDGLSSRTRGYDYIKRNQMKWYESHINALQEKYGIVKSLMFMHIPIKEYENVFRLDENGKYVPTGKCEIQYGRQFESIGSSCINSGLFALIKKLGSTKAVFSGHDHVNDFCAEYDGVKLVYLQCGGYETYTLGDYAGLPEKDWMQGATVIKIDKNGDANISQLLNSRFLEETIC